MPTCCGSRLATTPETRASGRRPGLTAELLHEAHVAAGVEGQGVGRDAECLEDGRVGNAAHGQAALQAHGPGLLLAEAAVPQGEDVGQGHVLLPTQAWLTARGRALHPREPWAPASRLILGKPRAAAPPPSMSGPGLGGVFAEKQQQEVPHWVWKPAAPGRLARGGAAGHRCSHLLCDLGQRPCSPSRGRHLL